MNTINNHTLSFKGIVVQTGKENLIEQQYGAQVLDILKNAMETHSDSYWKLCVNGNQYTLRSPSTKKTYEGPFTLKRHVKSKNKNIKPQLIIRLDKKCRVKYSIEFPTVKEVYAAYRDINKSIGITRILKIFELLEQSFRKKKNNLLKKI